MLWLLHVCTLVCMHNAYMYGCMSNSRNGVWGVESNFSLLISQINISHTDQVERPNEFCMCCRSSQYCIKRVSSEDNSFRPNHGYYCHRWHCLSVPWFRQFVFTRRTRSTTQVGKSVLPSHAKVNLKKITVNWNLTPNAKLCRVWLLGIDPPDYFFKRYIFRRVIW